MRRCRWFAALLLAACNDGPLEPSAAILGVYPLVAVNGQALPAIIPGAEGCEGVFGSGKLTLLTKRDYELELHYGWYCTDGAAGQDAIERSGRYTPDTRHPRDLRLHVNDLESIRAMLLDGEFTAVRFHGESSAGLWVNSPVFIMGPRQPLPESPAP